MRQKLFLLASIAALAVAAWLNVQPIHSQVIGGGSQVIGGGNAARTAAASAVRFNAPINRLSNIPIDTTGLYRNAKFIGGTAPCVIPTSYATNDQCLHPSVVYIPQGWNGYKYWMAMTPFPQNEVEPAEYENPEIVASNDGDIWVNPGVSNPIDTPDDASRFMADSQLWYENGTLYCFYIQAVGATGAAGLYCKSSTDGVTWSGRIIIISEAAGTKVGCPIVEKVGDTYYLWGLDAPTGPGSGNLVLRTSSTLLGGYSAAASCTLTGVGDYNYYHGDIKYVGDRFIFIGHFDSTDYGRVLLWGTSFDGLTFNIERHAQPTSDYGLYGGTTGSWDAAVGAIAFMYRPCLIPHNDGKHFDVWYSIYRSDNYCWIGRGEMFITPNPEYTYDKLDQSLLSMGSVKGFWPFFERAGTNIADYGILANDLTATGTYGLGSWLQPPLFRSPIHICRLRGEKLSRADDADFTFGNGTTDSAFSVGLWTYRPSQVDTLTVGGTWAENDTATITIGSTNITYTCAAAPTVADVVAGLVAAWNASEDAQAVLYDAHVGALAGTLYLVANTRSTVISMTASKASTSGTFTRAAGTNYGNSQLINKYSQATPTHKEWMFCTENGKITMRCYDDSASKYIGRLYNTALTVDQWNFIVTTYSASGTSAGIKIYVNGVQVDDTDSESLAYTAMENKDQAFQIGFCVIAGPADYGHYIGDLALPFVVGTELSLANIQVLYRLQQGMIGTVAR